MNKKIGIDFIFGLVEAGGCFTFSKASSGKDGRVIKIPTFTLEMSDEDEELLETVREILDLKNKIYIYKSRQGSSGKKRRGRAVLMIRDIGQIKNKIVPVFLRGLAGSKMKQLREWLATIGSDPDVPESFKLIHILYRSGFYDK